VTTRVSGWIFDTYADEDGIAVWIIDAESKAHFLHDALSPSFYVYGPDPELHAVCTMLSSSRAPVRLHRAVRRDLFLARDLTVLEIQVTRPNLFSSIVRRVQSFKPQLTFYNSDLTPSQFYYFTKKLYPLARCEILTDSARRILEISRSDSKWDLDYALPPFKTMLLRLDGAENPNHGFRGALQVQTDAGQWTLDSSDPQKMLIHLNELLEQTDPDILLTDYGDSYILPQFLELSNRYGIPLPLNRDPRRPPLFKKEYSYTSYGRVVHRAASQTLFGRWHIDLKNAFLIEDYWLDGTFELARLTGLNVQKVARTSIGSDISAMETEIAFHRGVLIPYLKRQAEDFKSAGDLILTDKGGLTYRPILGLHENVAELDFVSMYPSIMAKYNISAETVNCSCCENQVVPEIGYSICTKQRGLIPETLEPLVNKRIRYKSNARGLPEGRQKELYTLRAKSLKWILVACFGYTGYKNARFGKIEAHESINAFARARLIQAKEIVEAHGYTVLHMLVDSLWVKKHNANEQDYELLLKEIEEKTDLPIMLEGIYHWIAFLPSREHPKIGVPNRYFGIFQHGEIKMRGIELRRRDTTRWVKGIQQQAIDILAAAHNKLELAEQLNQVVELVRENLTRLRERQVSYRDLVLTYNLSHDPKEYQHNTLNAIVAADLMRRGVHLAPGEPIQYIVTSAKAPNPSDRAKPLEFFDPSTGYDVEKYTELLVRAMRTILQPFGLSENQIAATNEPTSYDQTSLWDNSIRKIPREYSEPYRQTIVNDRYATHR
jgi:DNA polymerase II